ncbi:MAG: transcriptional regulator [Clostridiales bacterium]|nr:transcriptional regulator [Clostridiales bacterium]MCF8021085.1 transcriptional regulator [Clostridiales bacterium]
MQKGLTIKEIAEACSIGESHISQWEKGNIEPNLLTLNRVSSYLRIPLDYFYECRGEHDKLKITRASKGLKQDDLAGLIGVSRDTIQCWELGRRSIPNWVFDRIFFI